MWSTCQYTCSPLLPPTRPAEGLDPCHPEEFNPEDYMAVDLKAELGQSDFVSSHFAHWTGFCLLGNLHRNVTCSCKPPFVSVLRI